MTNSKTTKRALFSSVIALILCFAMLLGTTFAWFTDSVTTGTNTIVAGNLDVEVEYQKPDGSWATIEGTKSLFSGNLWEPGHTEVVYLRVKNAGTLALKYKIMVTPVSENGGINVEGNSFKLSNYLVFGTTMPSDTPTIFADRAAARGAVSTTMGLNQANLTQPNAIEANGSDQYLALVVYMPETVGNEANYLTGTTAPSIDLGITVVATQLESESDSFGNTYDEGAANTPEYLAGAYYDYFEAVNVTAIVDNTGTFTVTKTDANSGIIASASGTAAEGAKVNFVVTKTSVSDRNFGITVADGHELNGYDIKVTGQEDGSLVQGQLYVGSGLENFVFYHNGTAMTVGIQGSLTDGQYYYNSTDGFVYFATTTFSPFQATYKAPVAAIGSAVYGTVADAFAAVKSGETITLLKSSAGNGIKVPSGSNFTVDFNSFTYDVNGSLVGSSGTETNSLQLLKDSTITFKNGTLTSSNSTYASQILIQNYSNLTLENMTVSAGTPFDYIVSNNNGNVVIRNTTINAAEGKVAFDVCRYSSYTGPEVTVEGNSVINGKVEISSSGVKEGAVHKLNVTGGTFNGEIYFYNTCPNFVGNIIGGTFAYDPNAFCADGYCALQEGSMYQIVEGCLVSNESELQAAASGNYNTIYLKNDISLSDVIPQSVSGNTNIDLNGKTLTSTTSYATNVVSGNTLTLENGTLKYNGLDSSNSSAIGVNSGASVTLKNVAMETNGAALYPRGDAAEVNVINSTISAGAYCVATNAATVANYNVVINLKDSSFTSETPIIVNVPCSLNMENCEASGELQGVVVRGGTAVIQDCTITNILTAEDDPYDLLHYFVSRNWGSGNTVNLAGITIGNKHATSYQYPSNVTIINTTVISEYCPTVYVYGNATEENGVTLTYDDASNLGDVVYGGGKVTINDVVQPAN